jgi:endonuclease/exonuclease/phosphatase family metal-dependent hydrolase
MPNEISIAFYNLENFFDTIDDPKTADNPFTPKGFMHWIAKRYFNKVKKISYVISQIGVDETGEPPAIIGLGEVENKTVLNDLIKSKYLKKYHYKYIHYNSADRRGMDVAILYRENIFTPTNSKAHPLILHTDEGRAYQSRDILYCEGKLFDNTIHFFVNHWPSRREGDMQSNHKRLMASQLTRNLTDQIFYEEDNAKILILGDFNTDPTDKNIKKELVFPGFFNPAEETFLQGKGSLNHQKDWHLFDQIILTENYKMQEINSCIFKKFNIYKPDYLQVWKGKYKGLPFRTYKGRTYQAGFSDHFPVYIVLKTS